MTGLLLIQLGTPDAPTADALKPYLRQFLSDPRVIENQGWKWKFILRFFILRSRPAASAAKYARIWDAKTGSPLLHYTVRQTELLKERFPDNLVRFGMMVGNPPVQKVVSELIASGCGQAHRAADVPAVLRDHHRQRHRRAVSAR